MHFACTLPSGTSHKLYRLAFKEDIYTHIHKIFLAFSYLCITVSCTGDLIKLKPPAQRQFKRDYFVCSHPQTRFLLPASAPHHLTEHTKREHPFKDKHSTGISNCVALT